MPLNNPTVEQLIEALRPFAEAYRGLEGYGEEFQDDQAVVVMPDNCVFEMNLESSGDILRLGHLANAAQFVPEF